MASVAPGPKKRRIDYNIDGKIYDAFIKNCSKRGFAPQVLIERFIAKYNETGKV